jgi:hypothetical protein
MGETLSSQYKYKICPRQSPQDCSFKLFKNKKNEGIPFPYSLLPITPAPQKYVHIALRAEGFLI